jgi:hypothetical protein
MEFGEDSPYIYIPNSICDLQKIGASFLQFVLECIFKLNTNP